MSEAITFGPDSKEPIELATAQKPSKRSQKAPIRSQEPPSDSQSEPIVTTLPSEIEIASNRVVDMPMGNMVSFRQGQRTSDPHLIRIALEHDVPHRVLSKL